MRASLVWERIRTLLLREGADPRVASIFYRAVVQVILISGLEKWVLLEEMENKIDGAHTGLLIHITEKRTRRIRYGM